MAEYLGRMKKKKKDLKLKEFQKLCFLYSWFFYTSYYYSLNPRGIFQQMTSFSKFLNQDLGLSEITGGRKLSEIKV